MTGGHEFIDRRNSSLFLVVSILFFTSLMASMAFMSAMYLRRIHMRLSVCWSWSRSSRRVLETTRLTAGKIRLFDNERSSCNSIFVHLRAGVDQRCCYDGQRTATFYVASRTKKTLGLLQRICIDTTSQHFSRGWGNRVVGTRKTGDGIEENDHVVATLNHSLCFLQDDVGNFYMS